MTWQLRRATEADLDSIMALERVIFASDAWSREAMLQELRGKHTHYLVAFQPASPERIEAYAGLRAPWRAQQAEIQTIAVAEGSRRHGLGRTLMLTLVTQARERGAREVFLEVRADNPGAQHLYASLGFEPISVRKGYYQPDGVDAIVMRLIVPEPRTVPADGSER